MNQIIGIAGGMGPRATVLFQSRILDRFAGTDQSLPILHVVNNGLVPDRSNFITSDGLDPVPAIQRIITTLEQTGCDVICMPCNTAHADTILGRLQINTELLHMPELAVQKATGFSRVAILATQGTVASGLYQRLCVEQGVIPVVPPPHVQASIDEMISLLKRSDFNKLDSLLNSVGLFLQDAEVESAFLACTELSFIADKLRNVVTIDTLDVLAEAVATYDNSNERIHI